MDIILYIIILLLLIFGIVLIITSELRKESVKCPPQKIIYQQVPENILDIQFSKENTPSDIYLDMFNKSSPWIGGFTIGNKAYVSDKNNKQ